MTLATTQTQREPAEKTGWQEAKEKRDLSMWREYRRLLDKNPGRSRIELNKFLKGKYGFASDSGFYEALRRGENLATSKTGKP